jgi:MoxR-like ATPase
MQAAIKHVFVAPGVKRYIVELTRQTREHGDIYLGASPRGSLGLFRAGQARAAIIGRDYVLPDDIKALAVPVLAHRMVVSPSARLRNLTAEKIVLELLNNLPVPGGDLSGVEAG